MESGVFGILQNNCYLLTEEESGESALVDCAVYDERMQAFVRGRNLKYLLLTHGHFDHILAVGDLRGSKVPVAIHERDAEMLTERDMFSSMIKYDPRPFEPAEFTFKKEGSYTAAGMEFYVIPTPGHTPGSVCYIFDGMMFTGDTLFKGSIGTTDFGGDEEALTKSLRALYDLPGDYTVYPGHGSATTLSDERRTNPYLTRFAKK